MNDFKDREEYYEYLRKILQRNLNVTSRTLTTGKVDTSVNKEKKALEIKDKKEVFQKALEALEYIICLDRKGLDLNNEGPEKIKEIIENIASIIGSTGKKTELSSPSYRTHEVPYGRKVKPEDLPEAMNSFYRKLYNKMACEEEPEKIASMAEKEIDNKIHPYEDGCGRTSKLIAMFILIQKRKKIPLYPEREIYYSAIEGSLLKETKPYRIEKVKKYLEENKELSDILKNVDEDKQFELCYQKWMEQSEGKKF